MKVTQNHIVLTPGDTLIFESIVGDKNRLYYDTVENKFIVEGILSADMIEGVNKLTDIQDVEMPLDGQVIQWNESLEIWESVENEDSRITINGGTEPSPTESFDMHIICSET